MRGHASGHNSSMDETLAMIAMGGDLANRVQQTSPSNTAVAAGGAITPDASITIKTTGKLKISANASYASAAGTVTIVLSTAIGVGPFNIQYQFAQTTDQVGNANAVFELDTGAAPGTVVHVHWQTTAGDAVATLGRTLSGVGLGAALLVEEFSS